MDELDRSTIEAIRTSVASAVVSGSHGRLQHAFSALDRAEQRLNELARKYPPHLRAVRQAREAIQHARKALVTSRAARDEDGNPMPSMRPRKLHRALRSAGRIGL